MPGIRDPFVKVDLGQPIADHAWIHERAAVEPELGEPPNGSTVIEVPFAGPIRGGRDVGQRMQRPTARFSVLPDSVRLPRTFAKASAGNQGHRDKHKSLIPSRDRALRSPCKDVAPGRKAAPARPLTPAVVVHDPAGPVPTYRVSLPTHPRGFHSLESRGWSSDDRGPAA